ncbi:MAG: bifunctional methylenetetrahydrofolate dehydrogenase/methenyltetrahydrofolate cyclohydrolase FolD [Sedimentisphaerales bacterium]|nr:bifunctional methylenetetrahydrofolate dehydrogenase/methenyltetrahydrofolate cyclohydrolase FolD [Sedimentisphaerales bacterium]MBN2843976.1 bifunctional methylenetetrahydrofolate dehydrogenase/methenyltetrahydrofolate cyclohydrolase FolD [Sedimentisphaerales bacterium]
MTARLIKGKDIAAEIRAEIGQGVKELMAASGITPGLVTILVGENPASQSYVRAKQQAAHELGFHSIQETVSGQISQEELLSLIDKYNKDEKIHGILVQLPLPGHIDENKVLYAIDPDKDVDGFHPVNVGRMVVGQPAFLPCTPYGVQQMLIRSGVKTDGAEVVVVGRSNIVGKPIANMLLQKAPGANATVTVCHTRTKDMASHTRRADILIVAAGVPNAVTGDMVKPGAVVIDVGVNETGRTPEGKRILVGDVDFKSVSEVASAITPVPGGVGPMTITMLMLNTLQSARRWAKPA